MSGEAEEAAGRDGWLINGDAAVKEVMLFLFSSFLLRACGAEL